MPNARGNLEKDSETLAIAKDTLIHFIRIKYQGDLGITCTNPLSEVFNRLIKPSTQNHTIR